MYVPLLCVEPGQYEVIALTVLSVPVFDTLRVMTTRILKRKSPFHPDKTHLHHMFIRLGCSHAATTPPCVRYYSSRVFSRGGADVVAPPRRFIAVGRSVKRMACSICYCALLLILRILGV